MDNFKLTPHFSFNELTGTSRANFLDENRREGLLVLPKLVLVAGILEEARDVIDQAMESHSGYRCDGLNSSLPGASPSSQHAKGEAADWSPVGPDTERTMRPVFDAVCKDFEQRGIMFGQMILETRKGSYHKRSWWIHTSLGWPFRNLDKCRQIMSIIDRQRILIKQLPVSDWRV